MKQHHKVAIVALILFSVFVLASISLIKLTAPSAHWPSININTADEATGASEAERFKKLNLAPYVYPKGYTANGSYLEYTKSLYRNGKAREIDSNGLPMVKQGDDLSYNPLVLAQFALSAWSDHLRKGDDLKPMLTALNQLLELQEPDGKLPYHLDTSKNLPLSAVF